MVVDEIFKRHRPCNSLCILSDVFRPTTTMQVCCKVYNEPALQYPTANMGRRGSAAAMQGNVAVRIGGDYRWQMETELPIQLIFLNKLAVDALCRYTISQVLNLAPSIRGSMIRPRRGWRSGKGAVAESYWTGRQIECSLHIYIWRKMISNRPRLQSGESYDRSGILKKKIWSIR
jgi:hypothetical protein